MVFIFLFHELLKEVPMYSSCLIQLYYLNLEMSYLFRTWQDLPMFCKKRTDQFLCLKNYFLLINFNTDFFYWEREQKDMLGTLEFVKHF